MKMAALLFALLASGLILLSVLASPEEDRLLQHLLNKYNKYVRPSEFHNSTINVSIGFTLLKINDLDEKNEILMSSGWLKLMWNDRRLQYKPEDYNGIFGFAVHIRDLWKPDIGLYNGDEEEFNLPEFVHALVYPDGTVWYIPPVSLRSFCGIDVTRFPYDEQNCNITLGSWVFHRDRINLVHFDEKENVDTAAYIDNKEFDLVGTSMVIQSKKYDCCLELYPSMDISLKLRRKGNFFKDMLTLPSVILTITSLLMFLLPPESKEKITLGAIIMLCLLTMLAVLDNHLPMNPNNMPSIGVYYVFNLCIVFCEIVVQVMTLSLSKRNKPVPFKLRKFFLKWCACLLCVETSYSRTNDDRTLLMNEDGEERGQQDTDILHRLVTLLLDNSKVKEDRRAIQQEWMEISQVLDRIFFVLLSLTFIIGSSAILHS